jgi:hypothetical protein
MVAEANNVKVQITEDMVRRMSERIENGQTGDIVVLTRLIETRQNFWLQLGQSVEKAFNEVSQ